MSVKSNTSFDYVEVSEAQPLATSHHSRYMYPLPCGIIAQDCMHIPLQLSKGKYYGDFIWLHLIYVLP